MNLKKLTTLLFAGVTAATPFATNAQNPTILQGNYISNVFGQANFVLNPNAQTNVANVSLTNATATRSTTTPLVATSEWNVTVTSANGTAAWATRSFDEGMKNQNCEVRFTYRGFQSTSKAQIKQGANVVAELVLTPSTTDPRIASINFPCGDLSAATTFVITDSATLSGVHEIGGIYVGLATNMANVAQAESLIRVTQNTGQAIPAGAATTIIWNTVNKDVYGEYNASTGVFKAKRAGTYLISAAALWTNVSIAAGEIRYINFTRNGATIATTWWQADAASNRYVNNQITSTIDLVAGDEIKINAYNNASGTRNLHPDNSYNYLSISRFPSSSELVVTPETQNVWGSTDASGVDSTTNSSTYVTPNGFSTINTNGKCQADGTNLACKIETLPPGSYKVSVSLPYFSVGGSATQSCLIQIKDNKGAVDAPTAQSVANSGQTTGISSVSRVFKYNSTQTNVIFSLQHSQSSGTGGSCGVYTASASRYWQMTVQPLDNASNSALYVQGPVKAAATGAAIPAGYVGEMLGTERTGTNGSTYSTRTTTTVTTSGVNSITLSLDPGIYICSVNTSVETGNANFWVSYFTIGGTQVTTSQSIYLEANRRQEKSVSLPVRITSTTTLAFYQYVNTSNSTAAFHELWCIRIN